MSWSDDYARQLVEHRALFVVVPLLVMTVLATALPLLRETDDIRYQFTPSDSPSIREYARAMSFEAGEAAVGSKLSALWMMVRAEDRATSLLTRVNAVRVLRLLELTTQNVSTSDGVTFAHLCRGRACRMNDPLRALLNIRHALDDNVWRHSPTFTMTHPIARTPLGTLNLGASVYDVTCDTSTGVMETAGMAMIYVMASLDERLVDAYDFHRWQTALRSRLERGGHGLNVLLSSGSIVSESVRRTSATVTPFLLLSSTAVLAFTLVSSSALTSWRTTALLLIGIACPLLGTCAAFGLLAMCGVEYQPMVTASLILIMAIGVDDVYLVMGSWERSVGGVEARLSATVRDCLPSMTMTTLTNVLSLGVGLASTTPAIATFCLFTMLALVAAYMCHASTFLAAFVVFGVPSEVPCVRRSHSYSLTLARLLISTPVRVATLIVTTIYWLGSMTGIMYMRADMSVDQLLLPDDPLLEFNTVYEREVMAGVQTMAIYVHRVPDMRVDGVLDDVLAFADAMETGDGRVGASSTQFWLHDFLSRASSHASASLSFDALVDWLDGDGHRHAHSVRLDRAACTAGRSECVTAFSLTTAFTNEGDLTDRWELLTGWRGQCENDFAHLNVTLFDERSFYADQVSSIASSVRQSVLVGLLAMTIVCLVLLRSPLQVLAASLVVLSVNVGVFGYLSLWGLKLDALTMAALLMAIGLSVDLTAHMAYHYGRARSRGVSHASCIAVSYTSLARAMVQSAISTLLAGTLPALHGSYLTIVFAKAITLVVVLGLVHALVLLPVVLVTLDEIAHQCRHSLVGRARIRSPRSMTTTATVTKVDKWGEHVFVHDCAIARA